MSGCGAPRSHPGRNVNFVHMCSMCFVVGDRQYHPAHACPHPHVPQHHQFKDILEMCTKDKYNTDIDTDPQVFAHHRNQTRPHPAPGLIMRETQYALMNDRVRSTGVPNCMGSRLPIPTRLNMDAG